MRTTAGIVLCWLRGGGGSSSILNVRIFYFYFLGKFMGFQI